MSFMVRLGDTFAFLGEAFACLGEGRLHLGEPVTM